MQPPPREHILFVQALASLVARREIAFRGDLAELGGVAREPNVTNWAGGVRMRGVALALAT